MKELKIKLCFLIFKHVVERSHSEACSFKNAHYPLFILFSYVFFLYFGIKKKTVRKFEYFFIGSEHL